MSSEGSTPKPEEVESGRGFTTNEIIRILHDLYRAGQIDFSYKDMGRMHEMSPDEALEHLSATVKSAGLDPEEVIRKAELEQMLRENSPAIHQKPFGGEDLIAPAEEDHQE